MLIMLEALLPNFTQRKSWLGRDYLDLLRLPALDLVDAYAGIE